MVDKFSPFIPGKSTPDPDPPTRPVLIIWPAGTPESCLPHICDWRRLEDETIEAAYYSEAELRESIHALALVKEAVGLGGEVSVPPRQSVDD